MNETIQITAILTAKEGQKEALRTELERARDASVEEEGNLGYALYESSVENAFVLLETYKDEEALNAHINSDHYRSYRENTNDLLANREVHKLTLVEG
ncbi:monooxygenase [Pontibacillus halophilus JSM 076056 = DSM 19796]|uniref:Monooxygenase n=1 Tax=Pontibacillus halophilus JSM 076056 = DSM 19796 TaxID=1385510 RepID=A0A0A5I8Z8_9BACI|nr:putative quinol monooxygenase [Pontibacillus halophilus]KGX92317.1 monooxygenase [Pontibacillus halophilus JSM 076056 = DSM 19796]